MLTMLYTDDALIFKSYYLCIIQEILERENIFYVLPGSLFKYNFVTDDKFSYICFYIILNHMYFGKWKINTTFKGTQKYPNAFYTKLNIQYFNTCKIFIKHLLYIIQYFKSPFKFLIPQAKRTLFQHYILINTIFLVGLFLCYQIYSTPIILHITFY